MMIRFLAIKLRNVPLPRRSSTLASPAYTQALKFIKDAHADTDPNYNPTWIDSLLSNKGVDFSQPHFRKLALDHFIDRKRDHLIQFAHQRHVFTDFFPRNPEDIVADVHVATRCGTYIQVGDTVPPALTYDPLQVHIQVFHEDTKLYSLVLMDADHVYKQERSEFILWMVNNIEICASSTTSSPIYPQPHPLPTNDATSSNLALPYIPPHPTQGSGTHRTVLVLLEQPSLVITPSPARSMLLWDFIKAHKLTPRGLNVWHQAWDKSVPKVYAKILKHIEPVYVPRPKIGRKGVDGLAQNRFANL